MHCINTLASKNNSKIRELMKGHNLFEMRDKLLIEILQSDFQLHYYEGILSQVSFDALAD